MKNPIKAAVAPLRAAAVSRAVDAINFQIAKVLADNPVGTDLNAKYPFPDGYRSRASYRQMRETYSFVRLCVKAGPQTRYRAPELVIGRNDDGIAHLIAQTANAAGASFDGYVEKLVSKVGECDAASVVGDLWTGSVLTVTKGETIENWKTQQIINVSCLGKLFNQWPTRLAK